MSRIPGRQVPLRTEPVGKKPNPPDPPLTRNAVTTIRNYFFSTKQKPLTPTKSSRVVDAFINAKNLLASAEKPPGPAKQALTDEPKQIKDHFAYTEVGNVATPVGKGTAITQPGEALGELFGTSEPKPSNLSNEDVKNAFQSLAAIFSLRKSDII